MNNHYLDHITLGLPTFYKLVYHENLQYLIMKAKDPASL